MEYTTIQSTLGFQKEESHKLWALILTTFMAGTALLRTYVMANHQKFIKKPFLDH
jgi:hypothetical protein